jgi:hypothetical protein
MLSGLKQLKTLHMKIMGVRDVYPESILEGFREGGGHLEEADVSFSFTVWTFMPSFAIEKRKGGSFCISETDC